MPFIIIFIIIPFIELSLFASVSGVIGIWTTLSLAFLTAIIGGGLVRYQGLHTLFSVRGSMDQGKMPLDEIFDGFCIVAAGALLITPGFLTDFIGFALLIPLVRRALRGVVRRHMAVSSASGSVRGTDSSSGARRSQADPSVIEGEYEEIESDDTVD